MLMKIRHNMQSKKAELQHQIKGGRRVSERSGPPQVGSGGPEAVDFFLSGGDVSFGRVTAATQKPSGEPVRFARETGRRDRRGSPFRARSQGHTKAIGPKHDSGAVCDAGCCWVPPWFHASCSKIRRKQRGLYARTTRAHESLE